MITIEKGPRSRADSQPDRWKEGSGRSQLYHETWDEILAAWKADRHAYAFELSLPALARYPTDWGMTLIRGSALSSMSRQDLALPILKKALKLRGGRPRAQVCEEIAESWLRLRHDPRAADWYREAFELGRHSCRVDYAWCRIRQGRYAEAESTLREGTELGSSNDRQSVWGALGWLHLVIGEYGEAGRCYREALRVGEFSEDLQDRVSDAEQAAAVVAEGDALIGDPIDRVYALSDEEWKRYPAFTAEMAVRAAAWNPDNHGVLCMASVRLAELDRHEAAERLAGRAYELAPPARIKNVCYACGSIAEKLRKFDEAERYHRQAVEVDPDFADRYVLLGSFLYRTGRFEEAEEVFRRGTACPRGYVDEAWLLTGLICRGQRRYAEAADCFRRSLAIDPDCTSARDGLEDVELVLERFPHLAS